MISIRTTNMILAAVCVVLAVLCVLSIIDS